VGGAAARLNAMPKDEVPGHLKLKQKKNSILV
jgi:hypothetical protein